MNAEDQLNKLRQTPPPSKAEKRKKIMTAIVLAMSTVISILFLVYAFIQKMEADKQREESIRLQTMAVEAQRSAEEQFKKSEANIKVLQDQLTQAQQALDNCKKGK